MKTGIIGLRIAAVSMAAFTAAASMPFMSVSAAERKYSEQELTAYLFEIEKTDKIKCLFYEDMPSTPYISVTDYLNRLYDDSFTVSDSGSGVYTVKSTTEKTMVIDTEHDKVHFDEYETFLPINTTDSDGDGPEGSYLKGYRRMVEGTTKPLDIDFGNYGIDLTAANGTAYFPLNTISDLISDVNLGAVYLDNNIYFVETMGTPYYDAKNKYSVAPRSKDQIEYTYKELCFVMDYIYGKPANAAISSDLKDKSFDEAMSSSEFGSTVKPLLLSENVMDFYTALVLLDTVMDDGGHTSMSYGYTTALLTKETTEFSAAVETIIEDKDNPHAMAVSENLETREKHSKLPDFLGELRSDAYSKYEIVKTWKNNDTEFAELLMCGETAVFVFNDFDDEVIEPFKASLDLAEEKGAKIFLIDVSQNTGGSNAVLMYMITMLTDQNNLYSRNTMTGNLVRDTAMVDKNLDGKVDEKDDEVHYSMRFAILTSNMSFSCANFLPCLAKDYGIPVIGETSGGGTCYVLRLSFPGKTAYSISGFKTMLNQKGEDVEQGAKVDFQTVTYENEDTTDYSKLYDIEAVGAFLDEYYANATPSQVNKKAKDGDDAIATVLTVLLFAVPVVIIAVVVILLLKKRKSKTNSTEE